MITCAYSEDVHYDYSTNFSGKGAAIGAATRAGVGAASEIITKEDQVKIPSETLPDFTLQQSVTIPKLAA